MIDMECKDFDEVWERVNVKFLGGEGDRPEDATRALMCYSFNNIIMVYGKPHITLDPGILVNYDKMKWSHLLRTYMDWEQLKYLKETFNIRFAKPNDNYIPLGYSFKPTYKMNGSCLIGFTFLVNKVKGTINVAIHTRVAEVTRRMMFDFILFYKFFKYLFEGTPVFNQYEWEISLYYNMMYQSAMFVPILHTTFDFKDLGISTNGKKHSGFLGRVERELEVCLKKESKGSGFAQMKRIRDLVAADMRGEKRTSIDIEALYFGPTVK